MASGHGTCHLTCKSAGCIEFLVCDVTFFIVLKPVTDHHLPSFLMTNHTLRLKLTCHRKTVWLSGKKYINKISEEIVCKT